MNPNDSDTSTNEEALDTTFETDLEDDDTSFDDVEDVDAEETDETETDEAATESDDETEEESEEDEGTQSPDEETDEGDTTSEETPAEKDAARAAFEQREQQRIAREAAQAERDIQKQDQQQQYLNQAEDDKDLAVRQLQIDAYNNRIEGNLNKLENGIGKAVASIDLFQNGSPEVKEELANSLEDFERMYVQRDANGDPVEVKGDVYQYLQKKADSIRRLTSVGARSETKAKTKAKARTETIPTRAPKTPKTDPVLDGFDEEANRW